jgi:ferredoxin
MPYKINDAECTACGACEAQCPNVAIVEKNGAYRVNSKKCTECIGHFDSPQCVEACPVDDCLIIDTSLPRYEARV